jgi:general L-amino acid transport system permease protein
MFVQAALLTGLALLALFIIGNVHANIARLNLRTGFGFLARPAGFAISQRLLDYSEQSSYFRAFLIALGNTLLVTVVSAVPATVLGLLVGLCRLSRNRLLAAVGTLYVETVRNVPLLLQLFVWYFAVLGSLPPPRRSLGFAGVAFLNNRGLLLAAPVPRPGAEAFALATVLGIAGWVLLARAARRRRLASGRASRLRWIAILPAIVLPLLAWGWAGSPVVWERPELLGFNFTGGIAVVPELVAMVAGLSVYSAAFIAELVRGGVLSVHRGQSDAGQALGLSRWRVYRSIVLPQALRAIMPPLAGQYILLLKNSSLGAAIAYPDLMLIFAGTALNQTGQPIEVMTITMATYLVLCLFIAQLFGVANRRVQLVER